MKAKHSKEPNDYIVSGGEYYRAFDFNWDNINSFDDFKKAMILKEAKIDLLNFSKPPELYLPPHKQDADIFQEWIDKNPDFDKYFMMIY